MCEALPKCLCVRDFMGPSDFLSEERGQRALVLLGALQSLPTSSGPQPSIHLAEDVGTWAQGETQRKRTGSKCRHIVPEVGTPLTLNFNLTLTQVPHNQSVLHMDTQSPPLPPR